MKTGNLSRFFRFLLGMGALGVSGGYAATTYYVSPLGDDAKNGRSWEQSVKSIPPSSTTAGLRKSVCFSPLSAILSYPIAFFQATSRR
jgi:hypothetical protein